MMLLWVMTGLALLVICVYFFGLMFFRRLVMKRNPEAKCATCVYWDDRPHEWEHNGLQWDGYCTCMPAHRDTSQHNFCGQHPDFLLEGASGES
jgi:hypothetical protein